MITKTPPHVIGNSSSTSSLPFDSLDDNESGLEEVNFHQMCPEFRLSFFNQMRKVLSLFYTILQDKEDLIDIPF